MVEFLQCQFYRISVIRTILHISILFLKCYILHEHQFQSKKSSFNMQIRKYLTD